MMSTCAKATAFLIVLLGTANAKETEFAIKIEENGAKFTEKIKVDVKEQTERYDVPQHRFLDGVSILKDIKAGKRAVRMEKTNSCYISKLDMKETISPKRLIKSLKLVGGKFPWNDVRKVYQNMFVMGKIQDPSIVSYVVQRHCLGTTMYKAKIYNSIKGAEAAALKSFQHLSSPKHRQKRWLLQQSVRLTSCSGWRITAAHQTKCARDADKMVAKCNYKGSRGIFCVYDITCNIKSVNGKMLFHCKGSHEFNRLMCCDYLCPLCPSPTYCP